MSASPAQHSWQNLTDDILRQVLAWTHPMAGTPRAPVGSDTLRRLGAFMQSSSWVCQHWRRVAEPLQHSTILVHVAVHLVATRAAPVTTTVTSNAGLIVDSPRGLRLARALVVCVMGPVPSPATLLAALRTSGVLDAEWPSVHTLRFTVEQPAGFAQEHEAGRRAAATHAEDVRRLNEGISQVLPALRHIDYTDFYTAAAYRAFPLTQLLLERTTGLQSIRVFADTAPRWPADCVLRVPVVHMHVVDTPRAPRRPPRMAADTLVELTLTSLAASRLWEAFVPLRADAGDGLEFVCLRSLTLLFFWRYDQARRRRRPPDAPIEDVSSDSESASEGNDDVEEEEEEEDGQLAAAGYTHSSLYGRPRFPQLERLGIHRFPGALHRLLGVFAASPMRSLVLAGLLSEIHPADIAACAHFDHLGSLDLRLIGYRASEAQVAEFGLTMDRVARLAGLHALALSIEPFTHVPLPLTTAPDFAHTLRLLRLAPLHDVATALPPLLQLLPSLLELHVTVVVQSPMSATAPRVYFRSLAALLHDLQSAGGGGLKPVSTSVRRVMVDVETPQGFLEAVGGRAAAAAKDTAVRGVLRGLVCGTPKLQMLKVSEDCVDGLRKAVRALVSAGIVASNAPMLDHLETMAIRSLE